MKVDINAEKILNGVLSEIQANIIIFIIMQEFHFERQDAIYFILQREMDFLGEGINEQFTI